MGLEETFAARAYLLRIQKVERGFKKELKQREKGLHQMPNSSKFVVPEDGLRSTGPGLRDETECAPARIRPLSAGRNLLITRGQLYENKIGNGHRGPRHGHRYGDARPHRFGRVWKGGQTENRCIPVARTVRARGI